jgi:major membrane immunogen (membrane-anchored lipoprotein)
VKQLALIICLSVALAGCSTLKKVTGQSNDTVLQGQREEIIPDDQKTARDPIVAGQDQAIVPCNPKKQLCPPTKKTLQ